MVRLSCFLFGMYTGISFSCFISCTKIPPDCDFTEGFSQQSFVADFLIVEHFYAGIENLFVHVAEKAVVTAIHDGMAHHQGRGQMMQLGYANGMGGTGMHPPPPRMVYAPTSRPVMRPMPGGPTMGGAPRGPRMTGPYPGTPGGPPLGMRPRGPPMGGPRGPPMGGFPRGPPMRGPPRGPPIRGPSRGPRMGGLPQVPHPGTIRPPMPDLQTAAFIAAVETSAAQSMLGLV